MSRWLSRGAIPSDMAPLAQLWHDTWHEAHASIAPAALTSFRTLDRFATRLSEAANRLRVAGPEGAPLGLCILKDSGVDQLYVAPVARGTGMAAALLADSEERLRTAGVARAVLDCAERNVRAARFYAAQGWHRRGVAVVPVGTADGDVEIRVIVFEKRLIG